MYIDTDTASGMSVDTHSVHCYTHRYTPTDGQKHKKEQGMCTDRHKQYMQTHMHTGTNAHTYT